MLLQYSIVDRPLLIRILWRMLKWILSLTVGMTLIVCYLFAGTAYTRNRDADYCDYYNERTINYAKDDCYVIVPALIERFFMFFFPSFIFFLPVFSIVVLGVFWLYLHCSAERLGLSKLKGAK